MHALNRFAIDQFLEHGCLFDGIGQRIGAKIPLSLRAAGNDAKAVQHRRVVG